MSGTLFVAGVSHRTAPLAVREALRTPEDALPAALGQLRRQGLGEALLISTCNRVELYGSTDDLPGALTAARHFLTQQARATAPSEGFDEATHLYTHAGIEAVSHAFRVASSLDSMVVGEPQVLGQLKQAFALASRERALGGPLERCLSQAFGVAKRVRSETALAEGAVSVSSIACELARKIFAELAGRNVLLLGAGKMGEAAARKLRRLGARLQVMNRTLSRAEQLAASCGGTVRPFEELHAALVDADVVISSTSATDFVIRDEDMKGVVKARRRRPLFMIDIAVPRDIDPRVGGRSNVFLYDVDDLQALSRTNLEARKGAVRAAEGIVREEVTRFSQWLDSLALKPTILALREQVYAQIHGELKRSRNRLGPLDASQEAALEQMCNAIANKLLHGPITGLKAHAGTARGQAMIDAAQTLFSLDEVTAEEATSEAPALKTAHSGQGR